MKEVHMKENEIKWSDKKRVLGIPCTFTKYYIDKDRLYVKTGFFKTEINEILLYRILDVKSSQNFGQKICGVGTITLYSADQSDRTLQLQNVKNPTKIHKYISNLVEKERKERGIIGREMAGSASFNMNHADGDCDKCGVDHDICIIL